MTDNKLTITPCTVSIQDNTTGEIRDVPNKWVLENGDFIWKEGNFTCDCNRGIFYFDDDDTDFPCGHERFTILSITLDNGEIVYKEEPVYIQPKK